MLHRNNGGGRVVIDALEAVMTFATAPGGFAAIGMAVTLMVLVRRSGQGRKRTD
jgi:hypothetical protein